MVNTVEEDKSDGTKLLKIDKRTLPKKSAPNIKHLRFARNLPVKCNECKYRPIDDGGNGVCNKYEADAACAIRKDIAKMIDKYDGERNADVLLGRMEATFENESEKLMFYQLMEQGEEEINPEVTKRMNSVANMYKIINEAKTKNRSVEVTRTKELPRDIHEQIGSKITETIKISEQVKDDGSG